MKKGIRLSAIGLLALSLAACAPAELQPPPIDYGQELCAACGMLIDDPQFAAASVLADGQALKFDDLGEMVAYHQAPGAPAAKAYFVHDYGTQAWTRAESARYVWTDAAHSPMGHGLAAFEQAADAQAFASEHAGRRLTFDEMWTFVSQAQP